MIICLIQVQLVDKTKQRNEYLGILVEFSKTKLIIVNQWVYWIYRPGSPCTIYVMQPTINTAHFNEILNIQADLSALSWLPTMAVPIIKFTSEETMETH